MRELRGKVAIVTGATRKRGLGRAIALAPAIGGANSPMRASGTRFSDYSKVST